VPDRGGEDAAGLLATDAFEARLKKRSTTCLSRWRQPRPAALTSRRVS